MRRSLIALGTGAVVAVAGLVPLGGAAAATTPVAFAVMGDTPYTAEQRRQFPALVQTVNADPAVEMVLHAGDVKSSDSPCTDATLRDRAGLFDTFTDPFVLTPGDNEWTDCHKLAAGQYLPTERLTAVRRILFPNPGSTLGRNPMPVTTQLSGSSPYVENVRFERSGIVFATVHVVGSNNDRSKWSGLPGGDRPAERQAEYTARDAADRAWIDAAFDRAEATGAPGVLLLLQAEPRDVAAFRPIRSKIVERARAFAGQVLLVHGDEHRYEVEPSYAGVANLTRLETFGGAAGKWLKVTADPDKAAVFSWQVRANS
jgi:hypothetical protein